MTPVGEAMVVVERSLNVAILTRSTHVPTMGLALIQSSTTDDSALRRLWRRLGSSDDSQEAAELQETARSWRDVDRDCCTCGEVVTIAGPLRSVTSEASGERAECRGETRRRFRPVVLVWPGRRHIQGN